MKRMMAMAATTALWATAVLVSGCAAAEGEPAAHAPAASANTLKPFTDEAEFVAYLTKLQARQERYREQMVVSVPAPPPAPAAAADSADASAAAEPESITNVQTEGVDEGDIVKTSGDYLIVLRRGRLFTLRVAGDALEPVDTLDAYAPGSDPSNTWYDEMLVAGRDVVVIGYSYERGGTEVGLFQLDAAGKLRHRDTYHLRSSDYYSAEARAVANQVAEAARRAAERARDAFRKAQKS